MTYFAILLLICCPQDGHEFPAQADAISWHNLKQVADDLGLWEYNGPWNQVDFGLELRWCQATWPCVAESPPASDAKRIPYDFLYLLECRRFAQERLERLEFQRERAGETPRSELLLAISNQQWRVGVWQMMEDAKCKTSVFATRMALKGLRAMIGNEAYHLGQWPDHVPWWTFDRIDK